MGDRGDKPMLDRVNTNGWTLKIYIGKSVILNPIKTVIYKNH